MLPDNVVHVFGTLCSRGTLDEEGNPKPTWQYVILNFFHNFHWKMSQIITTWGLAVAREAMASREARVAAILNFA